jgi:hypothetical protein
MANDKQSQVNADVEKAQREAKQQQTSDRNQPQTDQSQTGQTGSKSA